jgi:MFS family permease
VNTEGATWSRLPITHRSRRRLMTYLVAPTLITLSIILAFALLEPRWQTNDDVAMAMFAHGYGIAAEPTPNLYFSTVPWGYVVQALHGWAPWQGYTVGTALGLIAAATVLFKALSVSGMVLAHAALITGMVFVLPTLSPQFTLVAGMLTVAAVICARVYGETRDSFLLVLASVAAVLGFMVRPLEFLLVALVAAPLLPWRIAIARLAPKIAAAVFAAAIALVFLIDVTSYSTKEWAAFDRINIARAPFTDFGAGAVVKSNPQALRDFGYSDNDIDLVSQWFFADPNILDPESLEGILAASGYRFGSFSAAAFEPYQIGKIGRILLQPSIALLLLVAIAGAWAGRSWALLASISIFVALAAAMAVSGAPLHLRVFLPAAAAVFVVGARLLSERVATLPRGVFGTTLLLCVGAMVAAGDAGKSYERARSAALQEDLRRIGSPIFDWGGAIPFEYAFPVTYSPEAESPPHIYALGVLTYAPSGVGRREEAAGGGLVKRLLSSEGLTLVAFERELQKLAVYCTERHRGVLDTTRISDLARFPAWQVACRS